MRHVTLALAGLVFAAAPAGAKLIAAAPQVPASVRAGVADVALVGTVTALEAASVPVLPFPGAQKPVPFTVAVVRVDTAVRGAGGLTHVRVGFPADVPAQPGVRPVRFVPGGVAVRLTAGQKLGLFLARQPGADFFVIPPALPPVDPATPAGKAAVEDMPRAAKVVADPVAALKAADAKDRAFALLVLVSKHRTPPVTGAEAEEKPVPADESALILAALAEQTEWIKNTPGGPSAHFLFNRLGVTAADGYAFPQPQPGVPYNRTIHESFNAWLAGPGKDYRVKALVPKPTPKPAKK